MKIAIIVPTYNRPLLVQKMLSSLAECEFPDDDIEVIIAENGKKAGTEEVCQANTVGGRVRYTFIENACKSLALNATIKGSDADFFIFFDDDVTFPKQILSTYVSAAKRYGPGHFFGGPLIADTEVSCPLHLTPYLPPSSKDWTLGDKEIAIDQSHTDMFFGANWAAFRSDFEKVGFFSEELGVTSDQLSPLGEETVLQQDLLKAGLRGIYLPNAVIYHLVQKECYTMAWVRNRKARHGVTDYLVHHQNKKDIRTLFGVPAWTIRALFEEYLKLAGSLLSFAQIEKRTKILMRISYLNGIFYAARSHSKEMPAQNRA
jgi:glycosyltransferase involved in cell wall biosynthesis